MTNINHDPSLTIITLVRYRSWQIPLALLSMAVFRPVFWLRRRPFFWKLLGCGRNGTFDRNPDWKQWGMLAVGDWTMKDLRQDNYLQVVYGSFISAWLRWLRCEVWSIFLQPLEGHGQWDGRQPFGNPTGNRQYEGPVAVLTRASIRLRKQGRFWSHVNEVARQMASAPGFITSVGVGEWPYVKQATFSIWENRQLMKEFAYGLPAHADVIRKTRKENWYSEDLFMRFQPLAVCGTLQSQSPTGDFLPRLANQGLTENPLS